VSGLALLAIFCHALFYNAFFEDPMTWALMGLTALSLPAVAPARESAPAAPREAVPV
jgi:hypothetical protein